MADKKLEVNVQHIIKDIEAGKFTSFQSILNEAGGQHIYEAVNEELRKYLKENNAVMISATQLAHLRETGYKDFESEINALTKQLETATGDLRKQIEKELRDLKTFKTNSERKAPIGNELHKVLELADKGMIDLNDAVKATNQIIEQIKTDSQIYEKLKSLQGSTPKQTKYNFDRLIKNAQEFQKLKVSAKMVGGETETARSMAFKKDGKLYVISGSTDWSNAKAGKIGDYKTTSSFDPMHNLIQSIVNATLIRTQEGIENLPIKSQVAHFPINVNRGKYYGTKPTLYNIDVGTYQQGMKLISDLIDVFEGKKDFKTVSIPGSAPNVIERGKYLSKKGEGETWYYNSKSVGGWTNSSVDETKKFLNTLNPQQKQEFLNTLFGETDGKPWFGSKGALALKEAFKGVYRPSQKTYKTYGGMSLSALSSKFSTGSISRQDVINAIKEGVQTQIDTEELASRLFYGGEKYYSEAFVKVIQDAIPEISDKMTEIFDRELDKDMPGYLSGLSEEEKPKPSKYEMYQPDVWELEEKRQQAWIESGIERKRLGYTDKPLFDDKGVTTLADRMTRLVDFYQRVNNIFTNIANDINKDLPEGTQAYTGEELARTYLARKSPEVYDRYMRSKGLYEQFASEAQNLSIEDQVKWIREQLDTFIAEEGDLLNTFDTFNEIADERSKKIFSTEFARKIGYVGKPSDYVAPGTLYGLLTGSTFGVAQEYQLSEFDKQRGLDIYGRTLSPEALDKLEETQIDDDISKIDFYKKRLYEMTEELGISSEKMKIFTDYLDKVQKVADQAGIELDQVLEGIDEKGFIKKGSLLDKQLSELGEMPVETDLYLPHGKRGLSASERSTLMGLLDETGMDNLTTQYEVYLNEQDNKRKEELQKQEEVRVEKEKEFTKLMDSELESRLKFLYAETQKPEYLKRQEAAERGEDLGLTEEMFKNFPEKPQKGLDIGSDSIEELADNTQRASDSVDEFTKQIEKDTEVSKELENKITTAVNDQTVFGAGAHGGGTTTMNFSPNGILPVYATSVDLADLSKAKATSITTDYEGHTIGKTYKFLNDKVFADYGPGGLQAWIEKWKDQDMQAAQAELIGILTKVPSYKKSSGGLSKAGRNAMDEILTDTFGDKYKPQQGTGAILEETKGIHKDTTDIKNMLSPVFSGDGGSNALAAFNNIDWNAFQQWMEGQSNKTGISSDEGRATAGSSSGGSGGRGGRKKGKTDEEKAEEQQLKENLKTEREYQQYLNQRFSLLSKIESAQAKYNISIGKEKEAAAGVVETGNIELKYLDKKNEALIRSMQETQNERKAQMDYQQELKVATMQQQKLLGTKGAKSLWDVMGNDIQRAAVRITDFGLAAKALNKIPQDIQKIIQYTKELDAAMTNIRIVGGYTEEQAKNLMKSYAELGKQLGATTTEIAQGMNDWLRQGYEAEDQLEALVTASTKLSKLGMISTTEATTALTSALKAFNLAADDAIKVVDKLTKVDQLAAVSAGGIAESLQKASTSAKLAGMSMDELIGSVSVIGEVTQQSMDTVGNAMKSILARYGNVKASVFTSMGLDDDGETTENINDIEKVLSKLGIQVRSSATEMRSITDVLDDVNEKWDTFDTVTKNAIATAFGGTRMRENFLVLMENWDRVKELTEESANAAGTADEKYTAYTDSIAASLERLQNAWEKVSQGFEGSWLIKSGLKTLEFFVSNLQQITSLLTVAISTRFYDKIFKFGANTVKGAPRFFKRLVGENNEKHGSVTYDENGNMVVSAQETQKDYLIRKGTQQIVDTLDKNGITTNGLLKQIIVAIEATSLGGKIQYDQNTGKIISGLSIKDKKGVDRAVEYDGIDSSGVSIFKYSDTQRRVRSRAKVDELNKQQKLIDDYNSQLGTPAGPNQISGYSGLTFWRNKAKNVTIGDKTYTLTRVPKEVYGSRYVYIDEYGNDIRDISSDQQKEIDELNKNLRTQKRTAKVKAAGTAAISTAITQLSTTKSVGSQSGGLGGLISKGILGSDNTQSVEETGTDKAIRVGLSTGLSAAGGYFLGPLGAMLGNVVGEAASGVISTIIHRSELEMKQRVADAKEALQQLGTIQSTISEGNSIVSENIGTSEDFAKLKEYTDNLADTLYDYAAENGNALIDAISDGLKGTQYEGQITTISSLCEQINNGNTEQRKLIQKQIDIALAEENLNQYIKSQEEELSKTQDTKFQVDKGVDVGVELQTILSKYGISTTAYNYGEIEITPGAISVEKLNERIHEILEENKETLSDTAKDALEEYNKQLEEQIAKYEKIAKEIRQQRVDIGLMESGIEDFNNIDIQDWGLEGLAMKVAQVTENATDSAGRIKSEYLDIIKSTIKSNSKFNSLIQNDSASLGELTERMARAQNVVDQLGPSYEELYDRAMRADFDEKFTEDMAKIIFSANPERMKLFANAWNMTVDAAKKLAEELPGLSTELGLMTPDEVLDYYSNLSDIFEDLSDNAMLTAKSFDSLIAKYPKLLALYGKGEGEDLQANLLKALGVEQKAAYQNAFLNAFLDNEGYVSLMRNGVDGTESDDWMKENKYVENALNQTTVRGLLEQIRVMEASNDNDQKDAARILRERLEELYGGTKTIEWESLLYTAAKEAEIYNQDKIIKNLEEQKDALSKVNDERKKEIDLIKARDALENAKKEKVRVYRQGKIMPLSNYIG